MEVSTNALVSFQISGKIYFKLGTQNSSLVSRLLVASETGDAITFGDKLYLKLYNVIAKYQDKIQFSALAQHDMESASDEEELHSSQLKKKIIKEFLRVRLLSHGKKFYQEKILAGKQGKRQQLQKLAHFCNV